MMKRRSSAQQAARYLAASSAGVKDRLHDIGAAWGDPRLHEECGVFGIIGTPDAAALTALGLHALQHRGQEGAGIVCFDGAHFRSERGLGLVSEQFSDASVVERLVGAAAVGHTRYATQGDTVLRNVQPLYADLDRMGLAVAHNGNLTNARQLRAELVSEGSIFQSTSDSELFLQLTALSRKPTLIERIIDTLRQVEGAYALVFLAPHALIGVRDPIGIRPLVLGSLGGKPILASETCALDMIGATMVRDVKPGEIVICRPDGAVESRQVFPAPTRARSCIFELIYFARPNSIVDGKSVYEVRKNLGAQLARESPCPSADFVSPIPDSGVPAAIGYAQALGVPYELALIRSHFVGRTFIEPQQAIREAGVRRKHAANSGVVKGKRIVLIDDSIVRGTTSRKIVEMLRSAGAREVHLRIASPPVMYPDYYGIDTPSREELIAAQMSPPAIARSIGVDSLGFLSVEGLYSAMGAGPRDDAAPAFTDHCFTGQYPTRLVDQKSNDDAQPSFLS